MEQVPLKSGKNINIGRDFSEKDCGVFIVNFEYVSHLVSLFHI